MQSRKNKKQKEEVTLKIHPYYLRSNTGYDGALLLEMLSQCKEGSVDTIEQVLDLVLPHYPEGCAPAIDVLETLLGKLSALGYVRYNSAGVTLCRFKPDKVESVGLSYDQIPNVVYTRAIDSWDALLKEKTKLGLDWKDANYGSREGNAMKRLLARLQCYCRGEITMDYVWAKLLERYDRWPQVERYPLTSLQKVYKHIDTILDHLERVKVEQTRSPQVKASDLTDVNAHLEQLKKRLK